MDATFARVQLIDFTQIELRADFARYLCVLVSGYLDQTVRDLTGEFVAKRADPMVADLVLRLTDRTTNIKSSKLREHLLSINRGWETELDQLLIEGAKDALDSVVSLRHLIAHGSPADVTPARISSYYTEIKKVVVELRRIMDLQ